MCSKANSWLVSPFLPIFAHNQKEPDCTEVLVFKSNKLYNLYTEKIQLNYFKSKAQETKGI